MEDIQPEIRDLRRDDLEAVLSILYESAVTSGFGGSREKYVSDVSKELHLDHDVLRVLTSPEGRVMGCAWAAPFPRDAEKSETAFLFDVSVRETYRRKGYGRRVAEDLFEQLRSRGVTTVNARLAKRNHGGAGFMKVLGFELEKEDALWTEWWRAL
ncbi:MAG: GNAT family N-acetyltransferase [Spirochaetes bacterium]|jgi:predicted N-acetyltransferase YhbS|nr:GNAT family N-acetyltransferase [Spirochaetota bacterium]